EADTGTVINGSPLRQRNVRRLQRDGAGSACHVPHFHARASHIVDFWAKARPGRQICPFTPGFQHPIDVVEVKVSAIDRQTASCSLLVSRNAEARSGRWIDSPGYVDLELRFVQRP